MSKLWVGGRKGSGMLWVFDPNIEHIDPGMVYLFNVKSEKMGDHPKEYSRGILHTVDGEKSTKAVSIYYKWREKHAADFLERDKDRCLKEKSVREQNKKKQELKLAAELELRREEAKRKHEEYIKNHGKEYHGITISQKDHRVTHCYSCKSPLDSKILLECKSCHWMICYCGACGCGYGA